MPAAVAAQLERLREREEVRFGTGAGVLVDAAEVTACVATAGCAGSAVQLSASARSRHCLAVLHGWWMPAMCGTALSCMWLCRLEDM
jgi:hypothetical protein